VGVEKRLLEDARSFAKEVTSLDVEGFISRTLAILGLPPADSDKASGNDKVTREAGRTQRSASGPTGSGKKP
jgi:hypothetical protein